MIKQISWIGIILFFIACSSTKKTVESGFKPKKFVFKVSMISSQAGISNLKSKTDSLIDENYSPNGKDSLINKKIKEIQITNFLTQTSKEAIYIEVQKDTIWRYTKLDDKMIGDYLMIQKDNGMLNYYDRSKSINYRKYDLFSKNDEYKVSINKNDRKEIKGFDCFKLTVIKINKEDDLGNTIYEMYVTDQIDLPVHSVINLTKLFPNTFPMEIKISEEKLFGMAELYELIRIE